MREKFTQVSDFLTCTLKKLDIHCAIIIGSYLTKDKYIDTLSDIDICAFSNNFYNYTLEDIADIIINSGEFDFKDKKPKYKDNLMCILSQGQ